MHTVGCAVRGSERAEVPLEPVAFPLLSAAPLFSRLACGRSLRVEGQPDVVWPAVGSASRHRACHDLFWIASPLDSAAVLLPWLPCGSSWRVRHCSTQREQLKQTLVFAVSAVSCSDDVLPCWFVAERRPCCLLKRCEQFPEQPRAHSSFIKYSCLVVGGLWFFSPLVRPGCWGFNPPAVTLTAHACHINCTCLSPCALAADCPVRTGSK